MKEVIFLNGKFVPQEEAKISVLEPGFLTGYGVFETMRAYNGRIVYSAEHLKRFKKSADCAEIKLPYSLDKIGRLIRQAVKLSGFLDNYLRLTLWKTIDKSSGAGILLIARKYEPYPQAKYRQGFRACVSGIKKYILEKDNLPVEIKTTSRLLYELGFFWAGKNNFDEALILDTLGNICEGTRTNIFFIADKEIFTPDLSCGCLSGVTRRVIFDSAKKNKLNVYEGKFSLCDLYGADEAFLTNSLGGVMPLVRVGEKVIGEGKPGRLTRVFMEKYDALLK